MSKRVKIEIEVEVPEKYKYVAVDEYCPGIYGYTHHPFLDDPAGEWDMTGGCFDRVQAINWRDTLTEVKHDEIEDYYWAGPEKVLVGPQIVAKLMAKAEAGDLDITMAEFVRLSKIRKAKTEIAESELDFIMSIVGR